MVARIEGGRVVNPSPLGAVTWECGLYLDNRVFILVSI